MIITTTTAEYRPCYANGKKALFHRWTEEAGVLPPSIMKGGHSGGQIRTAFAIVEYEDGTIALVLPQKIRFIDNKFKEYDFTEGRSNTDVERNV